MQKISFKDFNLSEPLLSSIEKLEYTNPTEIQAKVIPLILNGKDIIGKSQTGSGKTAAFGIPICEKIDVENRNPQALILTPTRELCVQIKEDINNIGRFKKIRCVAVFGKNPMHLQVRELKQRVHVVVGTPGRTMDHIEKGNLNLQDVKYLIIDEADKMLNMGFIDQVEQIIREVPKDRVTLLFSATMPDEIRSLCHNYMVKPIDIEIIPKIDLTKTILQSCYEVFENDKAELLKDIIYMQNPQSSIIFCNTKDKVDTIFLELKKEGFSCNKLHGGMLQEDRLRVMDSFKNGEFVFLCATDVAARGIDVESLDLIVNYDVPFEKESYLHRIGRTGRAGETGTAITFSSPYEMRYLNEIEEYISYEIPRKSIPNREEVERLKEEYIKAPVVKPVHKISKSTKISKDITKIYINAGKKKKMRPGDIVGAITSIEGITSDDVGIIDISDNFSYIDILNGKGTFVIQSLKEMNIKGKTVRVEKSGK